MSVRGGWAAGIAELVGGVEVRGGAAKVTGGTEVLVAHLTGEACRVASCADCSSVGREAITTCGLTCVVLQVDLCGWSGEAAEAEAFVGCAT